MDPEEAIPSDCEKIEASRREMVCRRIRRYVRVLDVPDEEVPDRVIASCVPGWECRILYSRLGSGWGERDSWNEENLDDFLGSFSEEEFVYWVLNVWTDALKPICVGPFTPSKRDWLEEVTIVNGMNPVGFTSLKEDLCFFSDLDLDLTFLVSDNKLMSIFDGMTKGKEAIFHDLLETLQMGKEREKSKYYDWMIQYLPRLAGCVHDN